MAQWREEYLAALAVRDQKEKANSGLYDACSYPACSKLTLFPNVYTLRQIPDLQIARPTPPLLLNRVRA